jgi:hypothetical protein
MPLHLCRREHIPGCSLANVDSSQSAVFEDLAQEAVTTCRKSLTSASDLLAAKKDKSMDARLFLVRHLLILKEMTAGLELGRRDRRRDWQGISGELCCLSCSAIQSDVENRRLPEIPLGQRWYYAWICSRRSCPPIRHGPRRQDRMSMPLLPEGRRLSITGCRPGAQASMRGPHCAMHHPRHRSSPNLPRPVYGLPLISTGQFNGPFSSGVRHT